MKKFGKFTTHSFKLMDKNFLLHSFMIWNNLFQRFWVEIPQTKKVPPII